MMKRRDIRICFVGDSFVNGTNDPAYLGWAGQLCVNATQLTGRRVTYYDLGIRGDTSADVAARWKDECARRLPSHIDGRLVFSFGVDDLSIVNRRQRLPMEVTIANFRHILYEACRRYPTLVIGPPPVANPEKNMRIRYLCRLMAEAANDLEVPYLPIFEELIRSRTWRREIMMYDGMHPSRGGYAELAALIQAWPEWWFRDASYKEEIWPKGKSNTARNTPPSLLKRGVFA